MIVIFTTKKAATAAWDDLEKTVAHIHRKGTNKFTNAPAKHPTKTLYSIEVDFIEPYTKIVKKWIDANGFELVERSNEWIPKNDII